MAKNMSDNVSGAEFSLYALLGACLGFLPLWMGVSTLLLVCGTIAYCSGSGNFVELLYRGVHAERR